MAAPTPPRVTPASPAWGCPAASCASLRCTPTTTCASRACPPSCAIAIRASSGAASMASGLRPTSLRKLLDGSHQARRVEPLLHDLLERAAITAHMRAGARIAGLKSALEQPGAEAHAEPAVHVLAFRHQHEPALAYSGETGFVDQVQTALVHQADVEAPLLQLGHGI